MKTKKPTQSEVILNMLQTDQLVSPSNVYKVTKKLCNTGCMRLAARISDMRNEGLKIKSIPVVTKTGSYCMYEIVNNFKKKVVKGKK